MASIHRLLLLAVIGLFAASASATQIAADYTITKNNADPGLKVSTDPDPSGSFSTNLTAPGSTTFDLFDIWTNEGAINDDDLSPKSISVGFAFSLPELGSTSIGGSTSGERDSFIPFLGYLDQDGQLTWDDDGLAEFVYGPDDGGLIQIALSDATFNRGLFGTFAGETFGATVEATVTLVRDATADVPEPGTLILFALGLVAVLAIGLRRRREVDAGHAGGLAR